MNPKFLSAHPRCGMYDNVVDAFNPQFWANESLAILEENMVIGNLVHRDFEPIIQNYGDTVNTRRIGEFAAKRKTTVDNVIVQDATAANIQVVLNQHIHVSFLIRDGEESKAVKSLVDEYMAPAMVAGARFVDHVLLAQVYRYLSNSYGRLGNMLDTDVVDRITGVRNQMNINKAPLMGRSMVLTPNTETIFLKHTDFTSALVIGDDGTALREAHLGRRYGFDHFMAQNAPSIPAGANTTVVGSINHSGGYPAGTTVLAVNNFAAAITAGSWITVAGDDVPQQVVSTVGGATPTSITISGTGLKHAVANAAAVTVYTPGTVNNGPGYASGWAKEIIITPPALFPVIGQMVSFSSAPAVYGIIDINSGANTILLDRPLDAAISNGDSVDLGPAGDYNFAFTRNSLTLVVRPLAMPRPGTGALSSVVNLNGLSMRATITYDGNKQGHLVTLDMLMGVQVLDIRQGAVLLA